MIMTMIMTKMKKNKTNWLKLVNISQAVVELIA